MKRHAIPFVFLLLAASTALAQTRAGAEFQVNTYGTGTQYFPSVALLPSGDFVIAWQDNAGQDGSGFGILARRFGASGAPLGAPFVVNTNTAGYQYAPSVSADPRGGFIVAWPVPDFFIIAAQRYDPSGQRLGGEFRLANEETRFSVPLEPMIAFDQAGDFVVALESTSDGSENGIFAQRFDASNARLGVEFRVNTYTTGAQRLPSVIRDPEGGFVIAWSSSGQDGSVALALAQRFDAAGNRLGGELHLGTGNEQRRPSLVRTRDGGFLATWLGADGVFARRFDAAGTPLAGEFMVNQQPSGRAFTAGATADAAGNVTVAWTRAGSLPAGSEVAAARFRADGQRRGDEFVVNTYTSDDQYVNGLAPTLSADPSGNFVVTWTSLGQDGSGPGVFAQRYGGLFPAGLAVDQDAGHDGILDPGDTVSVRPSWRNVSGAAQTVSGTLAALTGPAGATYEIVDGTGAYGTLASGATAPCTDCYAIAVSAPTVRPAVHWDAVAEERLAPDAQGQAKEWLLHVGGSFGDVPSTSPFYRFAETLLHAGVTSGCTAGLFCPTAAASREQMAAFVLAAKEGRAYLPPACTAPGLFTDVPASSPFCRWVEELARRGVASGCGGSSYCPSAAVTREQMAVFLLRTLDPALSPPACGAPTVFADVPASSPFCRWIEELSRRGISGGCGSGNYCPSAAVTREQMSAFLAATFGLSLY